MMSLYDLKAMLYMVICAVAIAIFIQQCAPEFGMYRVHPTKNECDRGFRMCMRFCINRDCEQCESNHMSCLYNATLRTGDK